MDEGLYDTADAVKMPPIKGQIKLENVTFGYVEGENALENISMEVKPGQMIALVGPSGSGKSTIAKIILGFSEEWSGEVLFDGKPRREINHSVICNSMASVDQDIYLMEGTIEENISKTFDGVLDLICINKQNKKGKKI